MIADPVPAQTIGIDVQVQSGDWPAVIELTNLAREAIDATLSRIGKTATGELGILFTDDAHIQGLNRRWRGRDRPTNVLSFPQRIAPDSPTGASEPGPCPFLGDIALAWETIRSEAKLAECPINHHIAHLVIHGFLHILGYDHENDREADIMEALERDVLASLGIDDPYSETR